MPARRVATTPTSKPKASRSHSQRGGAVVRTRTTRRSSRWLNWLLQQWARLKAFLLGALKIVVVAVLPFVIGVRVAVFFYLHGVDTWLAISMAAIITFGLVAAYAAALSHRFTGRARVMAIMKWVAAPLVGAWCAYALLYVASANAKTDAIREAYHSVHPVLRLAVATVILADEQLVVTDVIREPADYVKMGLPRAVRTMHYRQADGWVHAVDVRTAGHGELKNVSLQLYFWAVGFTTLRHVGTADHLHVQLPLPSRPS